MFKGKPNGNRYALRPATEGQSHLYVALDQEYITQDEFDRLYQQAVAVKVKSIIHGFIRYLRTSGRDVERSTSKVEL